MHLLPRSVPDHPRAFRVCRWSTPAFLVLAALALLAGCRAEGPGKEAATAAGSAEKPLPGGTAVVAIPADPGVLNPLLYNSALAGMIYSELHDCLAEMSEDLTWEPRIATGWEVAADGMSLTYHLRPWRWADGSPLTARDVAYSFDLFKDERIASPRRGFFREVVSATALDSATVRYRFAHPVSDPVQRTWHHILPYHVVKDYDPMEVDRWPLNEHPLSNGPFILVSRAHNSELVLAPNPLYPGPSALLARVVLRIIPESSARVLALETGEVDLVDHLTPADAKRLERKGAARVVANGGRRFYYLQWNLENPRFKDAMTRRALSLAIDREGMIGTLLEGYGSPAASPIPPAVWNHDTGLKPDAFDPVAARRLLVEAGWRDEDGDGILERDGMKLEFEILSRQGDPVRENGGVMLKAAFADVGAAVTLRNLELAAGLARLQTGRFDAYYGLLNANLYGDPSGYVSSRATDQFNKGRYANARVDSLLDRALGIRDRAVALPLWYELQETLAADPPCAYLFYPDNLVGVSKRLRNVRPHLLSPLNNLAAWWIAPGDRKYRSGH